ncbi:unnamed protein product [Phytophthora fragariaefolia]|uniref:Unnamed protein product n=1 Tax=Phytophthora fragariaefolia TaxID=1490495 RepID=A0A9W7CVY8_9STRA|nr:unnamed protein product [Phytophthora fragariaefolia]
MQYRVPTNACRGGRGGFGFQQHQRHEDAGYAEGYAPYPPAPPPQYGADYGAYPPPQQGYASQLQGYASQHDQYAPPYPEPPFQQYAPPPSDQFQPAPAYQEPAYPPPPQGYSEGYSAPPADRYDAFQPPQGFQQQFQGQFQQPQQFQDDGARFAANPPLPPTDFAEASRARQQAYAPVAAAEDAPEAPPSPYRQSQPQQQQPQQFQQQQQQQQQQQPPLPPMPQGQRGDWNYPPPPQQQQGQWQQPPPPQGQWQQPPQQPGQWQQPLPQQQFGGPAGYPPQGQGPPANQHQFQRDQNSRFHDRRQDRHHNKPHRPPPPSYVCHNCNQPGHWKQHCPLFANDHERYGSRQDEQFQQRYGSGQDRQWNSALPPPGSKPQDPRRNGGSFHTEERRGQEFGMTSEPRGQPPLPDGPAPPLLPNSQYGNGESQSGQQVWKCEPCAKSFGIASQYEAHVGTHVTCSDCDFTAAKRVVAVHHQKTHGEYAGQGLKEIDVEGQKFMVLVGNSAEDIAKWREERRKKWLAMSRQPKPATATPAVAPVTGKRKLSVSSEEDLEEGEIEEDEEAKAQIALRNAAINVAAPESATAGKGDQVPPAKRQRKMLLCKWFMRGHCRFDDAHCKHSHDRSAFGCRAMMYKGSCSKGMYCPFSHDTAVLSGQRERSQKASKERATEQQWRGEQKSLLRKLLAKDVCAEQRNMLQIVHFLVANDFFRSSDGEMSAKMPTVKIEVLKSEEASTEVATEASDPIVASEDIVMEEASRDVKLGTEELDVAAPQVAKPTEAEGVDGIFVPVVEATACEQEESRGVSKSLITEENSVVAPSCDVEAKVTPTDEEEAIRGASSDAQNTQCNADSAITDEPVAFAPRKEMELVDAAPNSGEESAKGIPTSSQADTIGASAGETSEAG